MEWTVTIIASFICSLRFWAVVGLAVFPFSVNCTAAETTAPTDLMCELMGAPVRSVITDFAPEFGWVVNSDIKDDIQTAYQILVASSRDKLDKNISDLWDSGKVVSEESSNVEYFGKQLLSNTSYFWKVRKWNKSAQVSAYSEVQEFRMGTPEIAKRDWASWENRYPPAKRKVEPVNMVRKDAGHYFVDFGKAAFGTVELVLSSDSAGQQVEVHLGEKLSKENTIDRRTPGSIRYFKATLKLRKGTHTYTVTIPPDKRNTGTQAIKMPGDVGEVLPFRYCEIANCPSQLDKSDIRQIAVNYLFDDTASDFVSSDRVLNAVWDMCKYSIKATSFCGVYVDGDRERIPYEADAYINQLCHYCVDREYTMARFSHEYLIENPTWPTEWILHSVLMAWADYMYTGNIESMERYYDDLKAKTLISLAREDGLISVNTGLVTKDVLKSIHFDGKLKDLVDWPPASFTKDQKYGERDHYDMVAVNTVVNMFHYRALVLMSKIAEVLGRSGDRDHFSKQAKLVKITINEKLFDKNRGIYLDGEGSAHAALHANMFGVAFGVVSEEHIPSVIEFIKSRGMACSVYGAQHLLDALYMAGEDDYALELMTATHNRGWYNMIKSGSTISLEAWDWKYKNNLDWNHAWGAAPANIIPRRLMGVTPLEAGFSKMMIKPQPGNLKHASLELPTIKGTVHVNFDASQKEIFVLNVDIPANTTAMVYVPAKSPDAVTESGKSIDDASGIRFLKMESGKAIYQVGSGSYSFKSENF
ncbi:MAG: family 78 glycoside hydrolase catalytic domain [Sedimentisphaerales bacterium]|nr:family 78 glycoside hydrolase catalytic domain [Sedimentisphaerales bacterium]